MTEKINYVKEFSNDKDDSNKSFKDNFSYSKSNKSQKSNLEILLPDITFKTILQKIEKKPVIEKDKKLDWKETEGKYKTNKTNMNLISNVNNQGNLLINKEINVRKKIIELKKNIKDNPNQYFSINSLDLKHFSGSCLNLMYQSGNIVKDKMTKEKNDFFNKDSVSKFISDNKEIYIKNNIIRLMNNEIQALTDKKNKVETVLRDAENKLDFHYQDFNKFIEQEKENSKENEKKLNDLILKNKKQNEKKRALVQNNRQIIDDIDRHIKLLINVMGYCAFVCYALNLAYPCLYIQNNFSKTTFEFIVNDDIELELFADIIIKNFTDITYIIPNDPKEMIFSINDLETKILKTLQYNRDLQKQILVTQSTSQVELEKQENILNELEKERKRLKDDYQKEERLNSMALQLTNTDSNKKNNLNLTYFKDLLNNMPVLENFEDNKKKKVVKKNDDMLKRIVESLKGIESKIDSSINNINNFKKNKKKEDFDDIIYNRQEHNKKENVISSQQKTLKDNLIKQEKAKERSKKIVIKTRKINMPINMYKDENSKIIVEEDNKENDETSLIYYSNEN